MPSSSPDEPVKLFLSYGREDFEAVSDLYDRLDALGLRPWMDKRDLLPGQRWREIIPRQVQQSDLVLVCLSPQSVDKRGFFQREIRTALDAWKDKLQADIYLIPVRLAACDVPQELEEFNWVDLYDTDGWKLLLRAIEAAARGLGRRVPSELAEALASKKKQPVHSPAEAPADQVIIVGGGARKRLQTEYGELQRQYDTLTSRIAVVDTDLGRALDGEQRLVLDDSRTELAGRRSEVSVRMDQIERDLAEPAASERTAPSSEQKATVSSTDVAKGEAKPAIPAKPVPAARPDLLIIDKPLRLELVRVPAGEFVMGTRTEDIPGLMKAYGSEQVWYEWETPQHRLSLPEFYIGKYPVTVSQFASFVRAHNYQTEAERDGWGWIWTGKEWKKENGASWSHPRGPQSDVAGKDDHPVTQLTWRDAQAFCVWVSKASGREIRLPSEAEWEKAARGVDERVYPWGNQAPSAELCNFNQNVGDTTPVEWYPQGASSYGALGMAGNVWEWTLSLWGKDASKPQFGYPYKPNDGREDLQAAIDIKRVVRGGSFIKHDGSVRCAFRYWRYPDYRFNLVGFRLVCVSPPS